MKINYDFPWYLQNSEGFMALYTGLYDVATNISPISLLSALDIDNTTTPEQLKLIATLYGLRGDFVAIQDALIYNIKKWSGREPVNILDGITPLIINDNTRWVYYSTQSHGGEGLVLNAGKTYTLSTSLDSATVSFYNYDHPGDTSLPSGTGSVSYTPASDIKCYFDINSSETIPDETTVALIEGTNVDDYEENYWSGRTTETTDLLVNYIKAKVQIRNKNLTLQTLKQFFEVCLAHRDFNPSTDISVEESTLHFDLTVSVDGDILNDMVTLLSVDPYPFGKPTGISYSINYVQE